MRRLCTIFKCAPLYCIHVAKSWFPAVMWNRNFELSYAFFHRLAWNILIAFRDFKK